MEKWPAWKPGAYMDPSYLDCLVSFATVCCWWVLSRALDLPWFGDLIRYPINSPFVFSEFTSWGSKFDKITFCSAFKVFGLRYLVCFENIWSTHLVYSGFPCACSRTSKGNFLFSFRILKTFLAYVLFVFQIFEFIIIWPFVFWHSSNAQLRIFWLLLPWLCQIFSLRIFWVLDGKDSEDKR